MSKMLHGYFCLFGDKFPFTVDFEKFSIFVVIFSFLP